MSRKKVFSTIALFCIVIALMIFSFSEKGKFMHSLFWIPLVLSAVFLFTANRIK